MKSQKHLGYEHWFEAYLMHDTYDAGDWQKSLLSIAQYIGLLRSWLLLVHIENNTVRYFIGTNKDIGGLSSNLKSMVLRPIELSQVSPPARFGKERMIQLVPGGNVLDVREKYQVKRAKELEWVSFKTRTINAEQTYCEAQFCFKDTAGGYSIAKKRLFVLPAQMLAVDFLTNTKYLRHKQPKYLDIQKSLHVMRSDDMGAVFEVETFPYLPKNYYLPLESYDFDKHSFIIGASGSGKSKLIGLLTHIIAFQRSEPTKVPCSSD